MKTTKMLAILVLALGLAAEVANADFTFGAPTNLGPTINTSFGDGSPSISTDGLSLFFDSNRSGGSGNWDIWVSTRLAIVDDWGAPKNLGPQINTSNNDAQPNISADGLSLFFVSNRAGGSGGLDLWLATRQTIDDSWGNPMNLGSSINSPSKDIQPTLSVDGLTLFFNSNRPGGSGDNDIWASTRETIAGEWGAPVNLGSTVNSPAKDDVGGISSDGLALFFSSNRPGGWGDSDLWVTTRVALVGEWGAPVNLGVNVNSSAADSVPAISDDGSMLCFGSRRQGGSGDRDLWQVPIIPLVDLNGDGVVDAVDMCIVVDHWGTDEPLCDIGPMPWGDGIVDVQDLLVLAEHLFEEFPPVESSE